MARRWHRADAVYRAPKWRTAGLVAMLAWQFQSAWLAADPTEARAGATSEKLSITTTYQDALNAARTREALLRRERDDLRAVSDDLREQSADAARRFASAPPLPSLSTPLSSESYLKTAVQRMGTWQQRLQGTQLMPRP